MVLSFPFFSFLFFSFWKSIMHRFSLFPLPLSSSSPARSLPNYLLGRRMVGLSPNIFPLFKYVVLWCCIFRSTEAQGDTLESLRSISKRRERRTKKARRIFAGEEQGSTPPDPVFAQEHTHKHISSTHAEAR